MNATPQNFHVIETIDRRVLGAIQILDAVTGLQIGAPACLEALEAVAGEPGNEVRLNRDNVRIRPNRRGFYVIHHAH
jgi:hypothetical protein